MIKFTAFVHLSIIKYAQITLEFTFLGEKNCLYFSGLAAFVHGNERTFLLWKRFVLFSCFFFAFTRPHTVQLYMVQGAMVMMATGDLGGGTCHGEKLLWKPKLAKLR